MDKGLYGNMRFNVQPAYCEKIFKGVQNGLTVGGFITGSFIK